MVDDSKNKKASTVEKKDKRYEQKLEIMLEYIKETGKNITTNTVYKGYNIGLWKQNLRQDYRKGVLNISDELLKKFMDSAIIIEGKEKSDKTSEQEKYEFLIQMVEKTPEEIKNARMENGFSVRKARNSLQIKYNKGNCSLSKKQIKNLMKAGILKPSVDIRIALTDKFGLPENLAVRAEIIWKSKDALLKEYKTMDESICKDSSKYEILEDLCTSDFFHAPNIISISSESITELQKEKYWSFVADVFDIKSSMRYFNPEEYLDIDKIKQALSSLTDIEKKCLEYKYGLIGDKTYTMKQIGEEFNLSKQRIDQIIKEAMRKMRHPRRSKGIINGTKDFDMLEKRCNDLRKDIEIEDLDFSVRAFNILKRGGINTVGDLIGKSENELANLIGMGKKSLNEIREKRAPYIVNSEKNRTIDISDCDTELKEYNEQKERLQKELDQIQANLKAYSIAREFYLTEEDCFNPDAIIPGIERESENTIVKLSDNKIADENVVDSEVVSTEELERSRKLEKAKALIQLNKDQDIEINTLESQMKGIDSDE